jgi:hypothetical protein
VEAWEPDDQVSDQGHQAAGVNGPITGSELKLPQTKGLSLISNPTAERRHVLCVGVGGV